MPITEQVKLETYPVEFHTTPLHVTYPLRKPWVDHRWSDARMSAENRPLKPSQIDIAYDLTLREAVSRLDNMAFPPERLYLMMHIALCRAPNEIGLLATRDLLQKLYPQILEHERAESPVEKSTIPIPQIVLDLHHDLSYEIQKGQFKYGMPDTTGDFSPLLKNHEIDYEVSPTKELLKLLVDYNLLKAFFAHAHKTDDLDVRWLYEMNGLFLNPKIQGDKTHGYQTMMYGHKHAYDIYCAGLEANITIDEATFSKSFSHGLVAEQVDSLHTLITTIQTSEFAILGGNIKPHELITRAGLHPVATQSVHPYKVSDKKRITTGGLRISVADARKIFQAAGTYAS